MTSINISRPQLSAINTATTPSTRFENIPLTGTTAGFDTDSPYPSSIVAAYEKMYQYDSPQVSTSKDPLLMRGRKSTSSYTEDTSRPSTSTPSRQTQLGASPGFTFFPSPEQSTTPPPRYSSPPTTSPISPDRFAPPRYSNRLRALSQERPDPLRVWTAPVIYRQQQQKRQPQQQQHQQQQKSAKQLTATIPAATLSSIPSTAYTIYTSTLNPQQLQQQVDQLRSYPRLHIDLHPTLMSEKTLESGMGSGWADLERGLWRERELGMQQRRGKTFLGLGVGGERWCAVLSVMVFVLWIMVVGGMVFSWGR